jgi:hypothetical protein
MGILSMNLWVTPDNHTLRTISGTAQAARAATSEMGENVKARTSFWLQLWMIYILIGMGIISACIPRIEQVEAIIVLDPVTGGAGTSVAVTGNGFPTETRVGIRLGPPSVGATPQSYGDTITDANGSFMLSFTMPAQWPSGAPITQTELVVVVLNEDGSAKATAPFGYTPSSSGDLTPVPDAADTDQQVILAWHRESGTAGFCANVVIYESGYTEVASCQEAAPLARRQLPDGAVDRMQAWTEVYRSFDIEQTTGTGKNCVLTHTTFVGSGSREVSESEMQTIQAFLEMLVPSQ